MVQYLVTDLKGMNVLDLRDLWLTIGPNEGG